jgi:hypothetical protein
VSSCLGGVGAKSGQSGCLEGVKYHASYYVYGNVHVVVKDGYRAGGHY